MKIAYVLGEYPSLSETFIAREIEALRRRGFEIEIWALKAGDGARQIPEKLSSRLWAKARGAQREYSLCAPGERWAKQERANLQDVQHIHAGWASRPAYFALGAAIELGLPFSFSGHARDLWVENKGLVSKLLNAKFVSCCTREGTNYLQSLAPELANKVFYAPHGIEISNYEFQERRDKYNPIRVLAVGRLVEKKGFEELLREVSSLASCTRYHFQLTIIGDGPLRGKLQKMASVCKIADWIFFPGALSHADVIETMQRSDLLVMTSRRAKDGDRDGLPNVLLEAAACGLPIVSTRAGSIEDFLDESCAWLCNENEWSRFGELIGRAIEVRDESMRRAKNARARVEENFDIEKNIEVLINAFTSS